MRSEAYLCPEDERGVAGALDELLLGLDIRVHHGAHEIHHLNARRVRSVKTTQSERASLTGLDTYLFIVVSVVESACAGLARPIELAHPPRMRRNVDLPTAQAHKRTRRVRIAQQSDADREEHGTVHPEASRNRW
jgi:hypothetical protein